MSTKYTEIQLIDWLNGHMTFEQELELLEALAQNPQLANTLKELERQMTQLATKVPQTPPPNALKQRLMQSVRNTHRLEHFGGAISKLLQIPLTRALDYIRALDRESVWEMLPIPGVSLYHVEGGPKLEKAITGFVRLRKGALFPDHEHAGIEQLFVLQGTLINSDKKTYGPGDLLVMEEETNHYLEAGPEEDVLYLNVIQDGIILFGVFIDSDSPLM